MKFHFFHNWSKWEHYLSVGYYDDLSEQAKNLATKRTIVMRRSCSICNFVQFKELIIVQQG